MLLLSLAATSAAAGAPTTAPDQQKLLDDAVEAIRMKGEPILPADFTAKPIPDADNAAVLLKAAADMVDTESNAFDEYYKIDELFPLTPETIAKLRAVAIANVAALAKARQATTRPAVNWQIDWRSPVIKVLLPNLNGTRSLAHLIQADTLDSHVRGDDRRFASNITDLLFISRATGHEPSMVCALVAVEISRCATHTIHGVAATLRIGPNGAPPAQIQSLIAELLQDAPLRDSLRLALFGERMSQLDSAKCVLDGTLAWHEFTFFAPPAAPAPSIILADTRLTVEYFSKLQGDSQSHDYQGFQRKSAPPVWTVGNRTLNILLHPWATKVAPSLTRPILFHYRALADRHLAAAALALRWYEVEHDGQLPKTLEDLVPKYLPAVPSDPMADAQPLRYDAARAIVYSVGDDGKDDGGAATVPVTRPSDRWIRPDVVVSLKAPGQ